MHMWLSCGPQFVYPCVRQFDFYATMSICYVFSVISSSMKHSWFLARSRW